MDEKFHFIDFISGMDPGLGFLLTTLSGLLWEIGENTHYVINKFRENSGPSEDYRGDSKINVFGDVISCSMGYGVSYILSRHMGGSMVPALTYFVVSEILMTIMYRDSMLLLAFQLMFNSEAVSQWQLEIIPQKARSWSRHGYWSGSLLRRQSTMFK